MEKQLKNHILKISVIVPVYNVAPYLNRSLDCLVNQTLKDIEIILINDCSTDNSFEIMQEYANKDERIKTIDLKENKGAAIARNKGLEIATGEYLGFIDPDDSIDLNYFEELYKASNEAQFDIVKCPRKNISTNGDIQIGVVNNEIRKSGLLSFCGEWSCAIYKRELIENNNIKFRDEIIKSQDIVFLNDVVLNARNINLIDNVFYNYYRRDNSLNSKKIPFDSIKSACRAIKIIIEEFNKSNLTQNEDVYIKYFNKQFYPLFNLLFQNDDIKAKEICARTIIDLYRICKYKKKFDETFKYPWMLKYIQKERTRPFVNELKNYINKADLVEVPLPFKKKIFSIRSDYISRSKKLYICGMEFCLKKFDQQLIVSLTSYPARINTVYIAIESLLNQSFKPSKVILWLAKDQFPNLEKDLAQNLLNLKNKGLEIQWCEDIKSYKKLIPSLKKYPNSLIVTADDDIIYPYNNLKYLYQSYIEHPENIICHRVHFVKLDLNNNFEKYRSWQWRSEYKKPCYRIFPTTGAMVLYPPKIFNNEVFNEKVFMEIAPNNDDIWFWAMCVLNNKKARLARNHNSQIQVIDAINNNGLWETCNQNGGNDICLKLIDEKYPKIRKMIIKEGIMKSFLPLIFSIKNEPIKKEYKIITILGLRFKIKRKKITN